MRTKTLSFNASSMRVLNAVPFRPQEAVLCQRLFAEDRHSQWNPGIMQPPRLQPAQQVERLIKDAVWHEVRCLTAVMILEKLLRQRLACLFEVCRRRSPHSCFRIKARAELYNSAAQREASCKVALIRPRVNPSTSWNSAGWSEIQRNGGDAWGLVWRCRKRSSAEKSFSRRNHVPSLYFCLFNEAVKFFADHTKGPKGARTVVPRINLFLIQNRSLDDDRIGWINTFFAIRALKIHEEGRWEKKKSHLLFPPFLTLNLKTGAIDLVSQPSSMYKEKLFLYTVFFWIVIDPRTSILEFICRRSLCQLTFFTSCTLFHTDVLPPNASAGGIVVSASTCSKVSPLLFSEPISVSCYSTFNQDNIWN